MDKKEVLEAVRQIRNKKANFKQSVDLVVNLQDLDFKKPDHQVDFFVTLPYNIGKKRFVAALVDVDMFDEAKNNCDTVIPVMQFEEYGKDKKRIKKLANKHDFFIAQANIMSKIAGTFGRTLGPRNKMPNPKAGAVFAPKTNLKPLYDKLQKTVRVLARAKPLVQVMVASEEMTDEQIADNVFAVYDQLVHHLPKERHNIKTVFLKTTMGKPVKLGV